MSQPHASSGQVIDLRPLGARVAESRTSAILKARQLELIRVVLPKGKAMPSHSAPGEISFLCVEGEIEFSTPDGAHRLRAGDLVHLQAGVPHELRANEDASALLTICIVAA
jgi:quercetin dioxygenase-like cupin family protein